jgi:hypothetical protein
MAFPPLDCFESSCVILSSRYNIVNIYTRLYFSYHWQLLSVQS